MNGVENHARHHDKFSVDAPHALERAGTLYGDSQIVSRLPDKSLHRHRYVKIADRIKDLVKSGVEWISSVDLENALMAHPAVAEAAVIGVPHPKWDEHPLAVVVLKPGQMTTEDALRDHLAPLFAKFWLLDAVMFVDAIPKTSTGKMLKATLREPFQSHFTQ